MWTTLYGIGTSYCNSGYEQTDVLSHAGQIIMSGFEKKNGDSLADRGLV